MIPQFTIVTTAGGADSPTIISFNLPNAVNPDNGNNPIIFPLMCAITSSSVTNSAYAAIGQGVIDLVIFGGAEWGTTNFGLLGDLCLTYTLTNVIVP
jgi:hypothetical protein